MWSIHLDKKSFVLSYVELCHIKIRFLLVIHLSNPNIMFNFKTNLVLQF